MSHITRGRSDAQDAEAWRSYLEDQDFKANCPFGTNKPMKLDNEDIKMLGGKRKKIQKRKRKRKMKK